MKDCILETPATMAHILQNRESLTGKLVDLFLSKPFKKIVFVASGSSNNIANCAKYGIQAYLDVKVDIITPETFINYDYKFHEDSLILCLSQSGKSTNTVAAVNKAKECGYEVGCISMIPKSPITAYCDHVFEYGSDKPGADIFVSRGVPTSTLFLLLFALEAGLKKGVYPKDSYKKRIKEIEEIIKVLPDLHKQIDAFYQANKADFFTMVRPMILGIGTSYGVAVEGALKMNETIGLAASAYETEEWLHGPAYEVKKDHALFLIDLDNRYHERAVQIYKAAFNLTDRVYLITSHEGNPGKNVLHFNLDCCNYLKPLFFVVPFQWIASEVCTELRVQAITIYNHRFSGLVKTKL
jgi:glucoselysine-6-phosphate deglycase